jgi:putative phosphoesterase
MKLVVVSDNHRDQDVLQWIVDHHPSADHYIHLGDSEMKEESLTQLGFYGVRGNYPFEPKFPYDLITQFGSVKTLITHGHQYGVKLGLYGLVEAALTLNVQLVMYGHTHEAKISEHENILFLNPGSPSMARGGKQTFATIEIEDHRVHISIYEMYTNEVLAQLDRFTQ